MEPHRRRVSTGRAGSVRLGAAALLRWARRAPTATPAYAGDFPDPHVLVVDGRYWAYATGSAGRNLQVMSSTDLRSWTEPVDPLPQLPAWAEAGHTWSPVVTAMAEGFVLHYAVRDPRSGRQCLSVATADGPAGPFVDVSTVPLVRQLERGGCIDPSTIAHEGTTYLVWKSEENALGAPTHLWAQALSANGRELADRPVDLLSQTTPWQHPVMEGPCMVAVEAGFVLLYGASWWDSDRAAIGYATGSHPLQPFEERCRGGPWLASRRGARGPSGPATFTDAAGQLHLAYHAWPAAVGYDQGGVRALFLAELDVDDRGRLRLR